MDDTYLNDELLAPFTGQGQVQAEMLRVRPGHTLYRLHGPQGSSILKWFHSSGDQTELLTYILLRQLGVETLPVLRITEQALLLEDLESSQIWRLAQSADLEQAETGVALASWYHDLHRAGRRVLAAGDTRASYLHPWVSWVTPHSLARAGLALGMHDAPEWDWVQVASQALVERYLQLPQTFNYNDFAAENLALTRSASGPRRAVVFDYDCFATGTAYSDYRNVMYTLRGSAARAFSAAWGPLDPLEQRLDEPLSFLHGLVIASQRPQLPGWARPLVAAVQDGELVASMRRALE